MKIRNLQNIYAKERERSIDIYPHKKRKEKKSLAKKKKKPRAKGSSYVFHGLGASSTKVSSSSSPWVTSPPEWLWSFGIIPCHVLWMFRCLRFPASFGPLPWGSSCQSTRACWIPRFSWARAEGSDFAGGSMPAKPTFRRPMAAQCPSMILAFLNSWLTTVTRPGQVS